MPPHPAIDRVDPWVSGWVFEMSSKDCMVDGACDARSFLTRPDAGLFLTGWHLVVGFGHTSEGSFDPPLRVIAYPVSVGTYQSSAYHASSEADQTGSVTVTTTVTNHGRVVSPVGTFDGVFRFRFEFSRKVGLWTGWDGAGRCFEEFRAADHGLLAAKLCSNAEWLYVYHSFVQ